MALTKFSNLNLVELPDCIGLTENGVCSRFRATFCQGNSCPHKRTTAEEADAVSKAMERLSSLDDQTQTKIARKYYGGKRVWNDKAALLIRPPGKGDIKHV